MGVFDQITFSSFFDWNIFLSFGYIRDFDFSDQKLIAPSLKDKFLSGIIISSSNASISPRPSHVLHAPYGLLKLNKRGSISSILNPLTGHINLSDNVMISSLSIL